ncbi:MAG TPA: sigma-54 dependent transcriptional regulator [Planctomycetota bacterium]
MSAWAEELARLAERARAEGTQGELALALLAALDELRAAEAEQHTGEYPGRYGMITGAPAMQKVFELIERVAPSDVPVLVWGETGTGKELVAQALHARSRRAKKTFLAENCAAVAATLLESELFGHKKGAFTHAYADRPGHFVTASGGTLFLDEIGDMPLEMQAKLLRVLESGEVRPVGGNQVVRVDVRVVAASHRDLAAMVAARKFREDLYYRLNVVRIALPPLRERTGDVALLARFFLSRFAAPGVELAPAALAALEAHTWPGNVRQLENELRRAAALTRGRIERSDLSPELAG